MSKHAVRSQLQDSRSPPLSHRTLTECTYVSEQLYTPTSAGADLSSVVGTEADCVSACCSDPDCRSVAREATAQPTDSAMCVLKSSHVANNLVATNNDFFTLVLSECKFVSCLNGGVCSDDGSGFSCACPLGFIGAFCETS